MGGRDRDWGDNIKECIQEICVFADKAHLAQEKAKWPTLLLRQ
jgi:hypothetical protein